MIEIFGIMGAKPLDTHIVTLMASLNDRKEPSKDMKVAKNLEFVE